MRGLFITLEGIDGSGKTTQLELLRRALEARGLKVIATREPGGTALGERVRDLMLSPASLGSDAVAELFLMCAARAQHVAEVLRPALALGRTVLSDRYTDSTVAFQGFGRGLDLAMIDELNRFATAGLAPDLTLVFDLDPAAARARTSREAVGGLLGQLDDEDAAFHRRVREGYLKLAAEQPGRVRVIDAAGSAQQTHEQALAAAVAALER